MWPNFPANLPLFSHTSSNTFCFHIKMPRAKKQDTTLAGEAASESAEALVKPTDKKTKAAKKPLCLKTVKEDVWKAMEELQTFREKPTNLDFEAKIAFHHLAKMVRHVRQPKF
jgi:cob(I)alamin adenosyltransferase